MIKRLFTTLLLIKAHKPRISLKTLLSHTFNPFNANQSEEKASREPAHNLIVFIGAHGEKLEHSAVLVNQEDC